MAKKDDQLTQLLQEMSQAHKNSIKKAFYSLDSANQAALLAALKQFKPKPVQAEQPDSGKSSQNFNLEEFLKNTSTTTGSLFSKASFTLPSSIIRADQENPQPADANDPKNESTSPGPDIIKTKQGYTTDRKDAAAGQEMMKAIGPNEVKDGKIIPLEVKSAATKGGLEFIRGAAKQALAEGKYSVFTTHSLYEKKNRVPRIYTLLSEGMQQPTTASNNPNAQFHKGVEHLLKESRGWSPAKPTNNQIAKELVYSQSENLDRLDIALEECKKKGMGKEIQKEITKALFPNGHLNILKREWAEFAAGKEQLPKEKRIQQFTKAAELANQPGPNILKALIALKNRVGDINGKLKEYGLTQDQIKEVDTFLDTTLSNNVSAQVTTAEKSVASNAAVSIISAMPHQVSSDTVHSEGKTLTEEQQKDFSPRVRGGAIIDFKP
jgi:hypothetical protein